MNTVNYLAVETDSGFAIVNDIELTLTDLKFTLEVANFTGNRYDPEYLQGRTLYQLARRLKTKLHNNTKKLNIYAVTSDNYMFEVETENMKAI